MRGGRDRGSAARGIGERGGGDVRELADEPDDERVRGDGGGVSAGGSRNICWDAVSAERRGIEPAGAGAVPVTFQGGEELGGSAAGGAERYGCRRYGGQGVGR